MAVGLSRSRPCDRRPRIRVSHVINVSDLLLKIVAMIKNSLTSESKLKCEISRLQAFCYLIFKVDARFLC
jgi:hypothetical protein